MRPTPPPTSPKTTTSRRARRLLASFVAAAAVVVALPASPAGAISPYAVFDLWVGGSTVSVGGTYTPIVGNFGGGRGDDIFWYAPGATPDYLWISSTTRGSFTKVRKDIGGTYTPLVGDFAGDSFDDILWYGSGTIADTMWISVDTSAYFQPKAYAINGVYQPVALDKAVVWASANLTGGTPSYTALTTKDHIVWYRPGSASDLVWKFKVDGSGTFTQSSIAIDGSPKLVVLNADADTDEDLLAYQPGTGADALFTDNGSGYTKTSKTINGTYTPVVLGGGYRDSVLWHGPGAAPDAWWANGGLYPPLSSQSVPQISTAGPIVATGDPVRAFLFDPTGPDLSFTTATLLDALDPEQSGAATVVLGDFDNDLAPDAFFYRPGSGAEIVAFDQAPTFT